MTYCYHIHVINLIVVFNDSNVLWRNLLKKSASPL